MQLNDFPVDILLLAPVCDLYVCKDQASGWQHEVLAPICSPWLFICKLCARNFTHTDQHRHFEMDFYQCRLFQSTFRTLQTIRSLSAQRATLNIQQLERIDGGGTIKISDGHAFLSYCIITNLRLLPQSILCLMNTFNVPVRKTKKPKEADIRKIHDY